MRSVPRHPWIEEPSDRRSLEAAAECFLDLTLMRVEYVFPSSRSSLVPYRQGIHTYHVGQLGLLVHNTCTISKLAPDWATKGAHIHVDDVELAVRPGAGGSVVFKPVFGSTSDAAASHAIAQAQGALRDPSFRQQLIRDVARCRDYLGRADFPGARAKSGELNFLLKALRRTE